MNNAQRCDKIRRKLMEIKRYDMDFSCECGYFSLDDSYESKEGKWVKYEDVKELLKSKHSLQQVIERLAKSLSYVTGSCPFDTFDGVDENMGCDGDNCPELKDTYKCWIKYFEFEGSEPLQCIK